MQPKQPLLISLLENVLDDFLSGSMKSFFYEFYIYKNRFCDLFHFNKKLKL